MFPENFTLAVKHVHDDYIICGNLFYMEVFSSNFFTQSVEVRHIKSMNTREEDL